LSFTARSPSDPDNDVSLTVPSQDLADGLQYSATAGIPGLVDWIYGLLEISHGRKKGEGWRVSVGSGSQDLIYKAVMAMVNDGDSVLVESPVYAGVIPMFQTLHCDQIEVDTDARGICSDSLKSTLENWPANKPKPKVLYTVPYGCNPTGMTATSERRRAVLALAREHDFIILEGSSFRSVVFELHAKRVRVYAPRYPSYFQLELEEPEVGRVLRFDSLSKVLSAGIRIGFASGPEPLLQAMDQHTATSNLQTSSLTQVITLTLLKSWGYDGFAAHTSKVAQFYRARRDVFESALQRHIKGLAEWSTPEAGMFFWFKLLVPSTTAGSSEGDSETVIQTTALERGVLALPGTVFLPNGRKTAYVRAAFSLATEWEVEEAVKRLRDAILEARAAAPA
ncbi:hypothetical protein PLICRDRAFT_118253, partial [Plicaturopsis crispa FD-325 SS-3]